MSESDRNQGIRDEDVSVAIATQDIKVQFKGSQLSIVKNILALFAKQYPEVDLSKKISLNYDTRYLTEKYFPFIKIDSGSVEVTVRPEVFSELKEESPIPLPGEFNLEADAEATSRRQTKQQTKWSTKEVISLHLVASRIAHGLGITQNEGLKISDIEFATKANPKSIVPRLSEMVKSGYVTKDVRFYNESLQEAKQKESRTIYRITTLGIHWLNNTIDKKQQ